MNRKKRTILIVDDSPEDRELYRRYLLRDREYSYTFLEAELGEEGLELWQQHQPDAVLLDYLLPDLDGLEFLTRLQSSLQQSYFPVIMVTGYGSEAIIVQAMKAGAQDYLVKEQITPEGLQLAVNGTISTVQLHSQLQQRIERERLVSQITQKLHQTLDLEEILQTTVDEVLHFLHTDRVLIFRLQSDDWGIVTHESVNAGWTPLLSTSYYDPCFNEKYIKLFRQGLITAKPDIYDGSIAPCHVELLAKLQVRANLVVPILQNGQLWGMLMVHHCTTPRQWKPLEIDLLKDLATQVGIALQQAELYQQAKNELAERRRVEAELRESEKRFHHMADNAPVMVWVTDATGKCTYISQSWCDFTGQTAATALGFGRFDMVHPKEREFSQATFLSTNERHEAFRLEYRLRRKDGEYCWVIDTASPWLGEDGEFKGYIGSVLDISDRKRAEERLRDREQRLDLATSAAKLGVFEWNVQADSAVWENLQMYKIFGHVPEDGTLNKEQFMNSVIHPEDRETFELCLAESMKPHNLFHSVCRIRRRNDHQWRWVELSGQFESALDGKPLRLIGVLRDITNRKLAEAEREQLLQREQAARETAEQANRIKDEFLAVLSHELRSPLNPILGWAQLLQIRKLDEVKTIHALKVIEHNAKLQSKLIEDLLDVSRILRGKLRLNVVCVDLVTTIRSAMEMVRLAAEAKSIQVQHELDPAVGQVSGDPARLQQVVWNLLSNAVKFTPEGGQVNVQLKQYGTHAQITVSDTGQGISTNFLPYVFDYFRQADATTTRQFGGLGLGLAIVRHLVELHGGRIWAESLGEGQGATFTVKLPLLSNPSKIKQSHQSSDSLVDLSGVQVLIVEDDTHTNEFVKFLLEQSGARVVTATTAREAFTALMGSQPDLLISDIGMPNIDGYMLIQQIRALPPEQGGQIPALALTAYAGDFNQQKALQAGFQQYLAKPIELNQLVKAVATLIGNKNE